MDDLWPGKMDFPIGVATNGEMYPVVLDDRADSSRPACLICVEKHLSNALVLADEISQGYPQFRTLLIGNLSQAADESVAEYPQLAEQIREMRHRFQVEGIMPTVDEVYELLQPYYGDESSEDDDEIPGFVEDSASVGAPVRGLEDVETEIQKEEVPRQKQKKSRKKSIEDRERSDARRIWVPPKGTRDGYWRSDPRTKKVEPASIGGAFLSNIEAAKLSRVTPNSTRSFNPTYWTQDSKGNRHLIKLGADVDSAKELLVSEIANSVGVPCQWVKGIPSAILKKPIIPGLPVGDSGTIHRLVPGNSIDDLEGTANLPRQYSGLQVGGFHSSLKDALKHPDLARIAAMDLAVGNVDRNNGNLFYHPEGDRFYAIDNGASFQGLMVAKSFSSQIKDAYNDHGFSNFSDSERENLRIFGMTLDRINRSNTPQSVDKRLSQYVKGLSGDHDETGMMIARVVMKKSLPLATETAQIIKEGLR